IPTRTHGVWHSGRKCHGCEDLCARGAFTARPAGMSSDAIDWEGFARIWLPVLNGAIHGAAGSGNSKRNSCGDRVSSWDANMRTALQIDREPRTPKEDEAIAS